MSLAFDRSICVDRAAPVLRAGVVARDLCRGAARGAIAAVFERSFYLRVGADFVCIGEPSIGNGPTTLIVAARVSRLGLRQGQGAFINGQGIAIGEVLFDLAGCETWRAPRWGAVPSPAALHAVCATIARRAATASPPDSLAHAAFAPDDTPLARLARPCIAQFESWISLPPRAKRAAGRVASEASRVGGTSFLFAPSVLSQEPPTPDPSPPRFAWGEGNLEAYARGLVGLGPGLTPSGDDFLMGALAALDALGKTNMHATLGAAVVAAAGRTSPLSASLLRAAAAGHVGENLHAVIAAMLAGDADGAIAAAARIGHTSGWDALAGAAVTMRPTNYRC